MYMAPVVHARPPVPAALRLAIGTPVLLLSVLVMLPWLAVIAAGTTIVLGIKMLAAAPRALVQAVDYAGEVALGR